MGSRTSSGRSGVVAAYVLGLAVLVAGLTAALADRQPPGEPVALALPVLALLVAAAERSQVRYRLGRDVNSINLLESVLAPLLFAFPPVQAVLAVAAGQAVAAVAARNTPLKGCFNVVQWSLAAACGSAVVTGVGGDGLDLRSLGGVLAALLVVALVNNVAFAGVLTVSSGGDVLRRLASLLLPAWVAGVALNAAIGLVYVAAYDGAAASVLLFAAPLLVLHLAYGGQAAARAERALVGGLHRSGTVLTAPIDPREAIAPWLREVAATFGAGAVELVLRTGAGREVHRLEGEQVILRTETDAAGTLATDLDGLREAARLTARDTPALQATGARTALVAPLLDDDRAVGLLLVLDQSGLEDARTTELAVVSALAREAAAAFGKGRLLSDMLEGRRRLAEMVETEAAQRVVLEHLQEAVMPPLPALAGAELGVRYVASSPTEPTGGDLYDCQLLPGGELHLAVVDVLGHGVQATQHALSVAHTLRTLVLDGTPLEQVVGRADELLSRQNPDLVATVLLGRYDPATGRLCLAGGGHPPAVVVPADGPARQVEAHGGAIGWPLAGTERVVETTLGPGDVLVLYTDGLVEARKDIGAGIDALCGLARGLTALPAAAFAAALVDRTLADAERRDDTLALVLRRVPAAPEGAPAHR